MIYLYLLKFYQINYKYKKNIILKIILFIDIK